MCVHEHNLMFVLNFVLSLCLRFQFVYLVCCVRVICIICFPSALRDFLTAEDREGVFNADHFPLWYKRAAEQVPGTFVYSLPFNTG